MSDCSTFMDGRDCRECEGYIRRLEAAEKRLAELEPIVAAFEELCDPRHGQARVTCVQRDHEVGVWVSDDWTAWQTEEFYAPTLAEAMAKAVAAKKEVEAGS